MSAGTSPLTASDVVVEAGLSSSDNPARTNGGRRRSIGGKSLRHSPLASIRYLMRHRVLLPVVGSVFFSKFAEYGLAEVAFLYLKDRLSFSRNDNADLYIAMGVTYFVLLAFVFPYLIRYMRVRGTLFLSVILNLLHCLLYIFVYQKWQMYVIIVMAAFVFLMDPCVSTIVSQVVPHEEIGLAQGALAGVSSLTQGFGPLLFGLLFSYFTSDSAFVYFPQMPFCLGVVSCAVSFVFTLFIRIPANLQPPSTDPGSSISSH